MLTNWLAKQFVMTIFDKKKEIILKTPLFYPLVVVIINRADYKARMQDILSDKTKFDLVDNIMLKETITKETKMTNLLHGQKSRP